MSAGAAACPACIGLPDTALAKAASRGTEQIMLSLPAIHCVACISGVERALQAVDGVASARVNLSMKRVTVGLDKPLPPEALVDALELAGFEARSMDASLLAGDTDATGSALLTRIAVSGFAMMNVMLLSVAIWSGAVGATQHLFHLISAPSVTA